MRLNSILLVDDDKICNYIHKNIIQNLQLTEEINIASNGVEALNKLKERIKAKRKIHQLIFVDIKMPVMNGYEFIKKIHKEYPKKLYKTAIIVLTTSTHPKDIENLSEFKNIELFTKPLTEEKLLYIYAKYFLMKKKYLPKTLTNIF